MIAEIVLYGTISGEEMRDDYFSLVYQGGAPISEFDDEECVVNNDLDVRPFTLLSSPASPIPTFSSLYSSVGDESDFPNFDLLAIYNSSFRHCILERLLASRLDILLSGVSGGALGWWSDMLHIWGRHGRNHLYLCC